LPPQPNVVALPIYSTVGYQQNGWVDYEQPSGSSNYVFRFHAYNYYNGDSFGFEYSLADGVTGIYDGRASDFIAERPSVNGSLTNLSNFGTVGLQGWTNGTGISSFSYDWVTMVDNSFNVMAEPNDSLSGGHDFTDTQYDCN
jgi:hypothetical protein